MCACRAALKRGSPVPADAPESRLDVQEGHGQPALLLVRATPLGHPGCVALHKRQDGLEAVRRLQADPELGEEAEVVERQGFLEALVKAPHGRRVQEREILATPEEGRFRLGVGVPLIGGLELPAPGRLLALGR